MSNKKTFIVLFTLVFFFQPSCKKKDKDPVDPDIKRYYSNQRFGLSLHEMAEVIDTLMQEVNPTTGQLEHPVFTVSFDSVLRDDRVWDDACQTVLFGWVFAKVSIAKYSTTISDTFEYKQCYNFDYPANSNYRHIGIGADTLYMFKIHPTTIGVNYVKEDTPYSIELILQN